jgi:hypothetical protein
MVMNADNVLNETPQRESCGIQSDATRFPGRRVSEFFKDLID